MNEMKTRGASVVMLAVLPIVIIVGAVVFACTAESVEAASFNQTCSKDDDCIPVLEIVVDAGNCTQPCSAINKRDQDRYQTEFEKEAHDCKTTAPPGCTGAAAACSAGKCVVIAPGSGSSDAGHD